MTDTDPPAASRPHGAGKTQPAAAAEHVTGLSPDSRGRWLVRSRGSEHILDHGERVLDVGKGDVETVVDFGALDERRVDVSERMAKR